MQDQPWVRKRLGWCCRKTSHYQACTCQRASGQCVAAAHDDQRATQRLEGSTHLHAGSIGDSRKAASHSAARVAHAPHRNNHHSKAHELKMHKGRRTSLLGAAPTHTASSASCTCSACSLAQHTHSTTSRKRGLKARRHASPHLAAGRGADADGLVGELHVQRVLVGVRVHRDRLQAHLLAGADDAHRDLAPVRNEHLRPRCLSMGAGKRRVWPSGAPKLCMCATSTCHPGIGMNEIRDLGGAAR